MNKKIPFWQPAREYKKYKNEIDEALHRVLENGELVLGYGKDIPEFEESFAKYIGSKYAVMCGAGTQALYLAYRSLGIGQGDEVITTSHTFIATIDQIVALGATPILVDIGDDGLIDPELIEKAITDKTKAIVPVHLEGKVCDMDKIMDIANKYNLLVIEDSAQAIGAKGIGRGNATCFSMFPAKVLGSLGNSGMVITNDGKLAEKMRMMRCNWNIGKNQDVDNVEFGMNLEPDNIQASVLNVKLKYLPERLERRKWVAEKYDLEFKNLPIKLPIKQENRIYQDYVIRPERKDELCNHLNDNGIGILGHNLIPNHCYPKLNLNFSLPNTEKYIKDQIRIPCNPDLTDEEVIYIINTIKKFYE